MRGFWLILFLAVASLLPAAAKVFAFAGLNCQCEVPDKWYFQDIPGDLVDVVDNDRQRFFGLRVKSVSRLITLDNKELIRGLEDSMMTRGFNITERKDVVLRGVTFHEICMKKDLGNRALYDCIYVALADGHGYSMELSDYAGNPDEDEDLKAMVASFKFLKPPLVHQAATWDNFFTPKDNLPHDAAYLLGYRVARVFFVLSFIACPFVILALVGLGIYGLVRYLDSSSRRSYPRPPSSPPSQPKYVQPPPRRPPPA